MVGDDHKLRLRAISRALELGIDYFDTAAAYGAGRSETNLGIALRELGAHPTIATKVTLEEPDFGDIAKAVMRSVEASLRRLDVDHLDIVHLHNRFGEARAARSPFGSGAQITAEDAIAAAEALDRLAERGLVGCIGCCAFGGEPPVIRHVIESDIYDSVIVNYSLLNSTAWTAANGANDLMDYGQVGQLAGDRNLAVVALRVLEGGALAGAAAADEPNAKRARALAFLSAAADGGLVQPAIRYTLSNSQVSTVVVGFSDIAQVEEASLASDNGPLDAATLLRIESLRQSDFGRRV